MQAFPDQLTSHGGHGVQAIVRDVGGPAFYVHQIFQVKIRTYAIFQAIIA